MSNERKDSLPDGREKIPVRGRSKIWGEPKERRGKRVEGTEDDIFKWATLRYFEIRNEIE